MRKKYSEIDSIKKFIPTQRLVADRYLVKMPLREDLISLEYAAFDRHNERNVALKILPDKYFKKRFAVRAIKNELESTLLLEHDHIVRFHGLERWKYFWFTTSEYVAGVTLSQYLVDKGGRLPLEDVVKLLRPAATAIDFAHEKTPPVIHGDIRPPTILVRDDGHVKVADFGVSHIVSRIAIHHASGKIKHSVLPYKAPEQVEEDAVISNKADIYSLAAVAYELISGKPVPGGEHIPKIVGIPDSTNNALSRALAKNSDDRPDKATEFISILADEPQVYSMNETINEGTGQEVELVEPGEDKIKDRPDDTEKAASKTPLYLFLCGLILLLVAFGWYFTTPKKTKEAKPVRQPVRTRVKAVPHKIPDDKKVKDESSADTAEVKKREAVKPPLGDVTIESRPSGAEVYLDGKKQGSTPLTLFSLREGVKKLMLAKEGYQSAEKDVVVKAEQMTTVSTALTEDFGSLHIVSKPEGAVVLINGKQSGVTPLDVEQVKKGRYRVRIKKTDYVEWKTEVSVNPGEHLTVSAEMDPEYGGIFIASRPDGALVYIDGEERGITPLTLEHVRTGDITVQLEKTCYESVTATIGIQGETISEKEFTLTPVCGGLDVKSRPSAAQWYLDGDYIGLTPGKVDRVETGRHQIKILHPDYVEWEKTIDVRSGEIEIIETELEPVPPQPGEEMVDPVTRMEFVWIKEGCFMMGAEEDELGRSADEGPLHDVCLEEGFWIGKYEVMQGEWKRVMEGNPSFFSKGDDYPVERVSWNDVRLFMEKVNLMNDDKEYVYRLPTEAEWEYACKGIKRQTVMSESVIGTASVAWFDRNSKRTPYPTGWKMPNSYKLYDMLGNVYEWVMDAYDENAYQTHAKTDPVVREGGGLRVIRGGSWYHSETSCRCAHRHYYKSDSGNYYTGFRLVKARSGS